MYLKFLKSKGTRGTTQSFLRLLDLDVAVRLPQPHKPYPRYPNGVNSNHYCPRALYPPPPDKQDIDGCRILQDAV